MECNLVSIVAQFGEKTVTLVTLPMSMCEKREGEKTVGIFLLGLRQTPGSQGSWSVGHGFTEFLIGGSRPQGIEKNIGLVGCGHSV